ncbi:MAG: hypothetical protein H7Z11_16440 [Verrucomicrobia bacterium]|nr:hypothetical protein [Leptolyngbya sp. ES-bin-22]
MPIQSKNWGDRKMSPFEADATRQQPLTANKAAKAHPTGVSFFTAAF